MNRDRQMMKDIENKHLQAREEYAKNKSYLKETLVHEKTNEYVHPNEIKQEEESNKEEVNKNKKTE